MTMKSLGEKYHKTLGEIMQMQAGEAYEILLMDFEQSMYKKDLEDAYKMLKK